MNKCKKCLLVLSLIMFIVSGCSQNHTQNPNESVPRFVTRIDVICHRENTTTLRHYTTQEKIEPVLICLRLLEPKGKADRDPERLIGDTYRIVLYLSNGGRSIYHLQADRYLSRDHHPWERVNEKQAQKLYPLLMRMASDHI